MLPACSAYCRLAPCSPLCPAMSGSDKPTRRRCCWQGEGGCEAEPYKTSRYCRKHRDLMARGYYAKKKIATLSEMNERYKFYRRAHGLAMRKEK